MGRHRKASGRTYEVVFQDEFAATAICTYLCPYCSKEAIARLTVHPDGYAHLDAGGFFEPLRCDRCGNTSSVAFLREQRI